MSMFQADVEKRTRIAESRIRSLTDEVERLRAALLKISECTCGGETGQPDSHHDISCPLALTSHERNTP